MKAITFSDPGGPEVLRLTDVPDPNPGPGQLLVRVRATALNRADLLQRRGHYPPPPGESDILGLELAGEIEAVGEGVEGFVPGDRVCALVGGGGYAEKAVVDHRLAMPIPDGWSFADAAAVPESFLTAHDSLVTLGGLAAGEVVLIHAAGSGLGTASVQMARHAGARVLVTAGTADKLDVACRLGAEVGCNYKERDFADWVMEITEGRGVDLIQDPVGAAFWERNFRCLREKGRLVVLGLLGGSKAEVDLGLLLRKRVAVMGTVLRQRSLDEKAALVRRFQDLWLPALARGDIRPVIDSVFSLEQAAEA
ncbi:MAG: NAD(P)H-quinone oxidoreductase, partial [Nitrospirales bacterium]